ncbi:hypothetical protein RQP46_006692 [Phenoliferia psychrophenolica]
MRSFCRQLLLLAATALAVSARSSFRRVNVNERPQELEKRATSAPQFTLYSDKWTGGGSPPAASAISGCWLLSGPADMAEGWRELTAAQRSSVKADYAQAGIKLIVSAFGATDTPTSSGADPVKAANDITSFVKTYSLDGVDVDYEDFNAMNGGTAEAWLISFTNQLRANLPSPYIISHAPVAPWFTDDASLYPGGGYLHINNVVGSKIDFYNAQGRGMDRSHGVRRSQWLPCYGLGQRRHVTIDHEDHLDNNCQGRYHH